MKNLKLILNYLWQFIKFIFNLLKKKTAWIVILFLAWTWLIGWFFSNYKIVSPIKKFNLEFQWIWEKRQNTPVKTEKPQQEASGVQPVPEKVTPTPKKETFNSPKEAIYVYFGNDPVAYAVAKAESRLNCKVISKTDDYGLFQINKVHLWRFTNRNLDPLDCWDNSRIAAEIQAEQGWWPWSVYKSGRYLTFL